MTESDPYAAFREAAEAVEEFSYQLRRAHPDHEVSTRELVEREVIADE